MIEFTYIHSSTRIYILLSVHTINVRTCIKIEWRDNLYYYKEELINIIKPDQPDPAAARVLQETLGRQFGEMRTMMQFFSKALTLEEKKHNFET